jgi:hypothetical protein
MDGWSIVAVTASAVRHDERCPAGVLCSLTVSDGMMQLK